MIRETDSDAPQRMVVATRFQGPDEINRLNDLRARGQDRIGVRLLTLFTKGRTLTL
jgi:hypothetical protein